MGEPPATTLDEVRTAEVIGSLCLATDLAMGFPFEHGLQSTLVAMRLADRLGLDQQAALETYFGCLLFYAGCTTDAEVASEVFRDGALYEHFQPVIFGSPGETVAGVMRALADPDRGRFARTLQGAARFPRAARGHQRHMVAMCEVAQMLSERLGMPDGVRGLFDVLAARWQGNGTPRGLGGEQIPAAMRVIHVARDATFQSMLRGVDQAVHLTRERAGKAFDPDVAAALVDDADSLLDVGESGSVWREVLDRGPRPARWWR